LVIYNPIAGRRRGGRLRAVVKAMRALGAEVTVTATRAPGHAGTLARAVWDSNGTDAQPDAVVAAGGDGTIGEIAGGLLGSDVALGIVPLGTANVLAHELGMLKGGWHAGALVRQLIAGGVRPVHLGRARLQGTVRSFVMMAGAGFDGAAVRAVNPALKRAIGRLAYGWAGLATLARGDGGRVRLVGGGESVEADWAVVSNGRHYGGAYVLAPQASIFVPRLTAVAVANGARLGMVGPLLRLGLGHLSPGGGVRFIEGDSFTLEPLGDEPVWLQCDGDPVGRLPAKIDLFAQTVRLIAGSPAAAGAAGAACGNLSATNLND